jgi:hypothetical protein
MQVSVHHYLGLESLGSQLTVTDEQQTDAGLVLDGRQAQVLVYIGQLGRSDVLSVEVILVECVNLDVAFHGGCSVPRYT